MSITHRFLTYNNSKQKQQNKNIVFLRNKNSCMSITHPLTYNNSKQKHSKIKTLLPPKQEFLHVDYSPLSNIQQQQTKTAK